MISAIQFVAGLVSVISVSLAAGMYSNTGKMNKFSWGFGSLSIWIVFEFMNELIPHSFLYVASKVFLFAGLVTIALILSRK